MTPTQIPDRTADLPQRRPRRGGFELAPGKTESANALARTAADYAALREISLGANEAAQTLGLDPSRLWQLLAARKIYGFQRKGVWYLSIFQFDGDRVLPGLEGGRALLAKRPSSRRGLLLVHHTQP